MRGIVLSSTTDTLKIEMTESPSTNPRAVVTYADKTSSAFTPGKQTTEVADASTTAICAAPAASTQRVIPWVCIPNVNSATITLTPKVDENGTLSPMGEYSVGPGDSLIFDGDVWRVVDGNGYHLPMENLCLNPDFSTVLRGTHTAAIKTLGTASSEQNCQLLGWMLKTGGGTVDVDVDQDTTNVFDCRCCAKVTIGAEGDDYVGLQQTWNSAEKLYGDGAAKDLVSMLRGKTVNFFATLKNSHASVSTKLQIVTDGTGGTTTNSSANTGDTNANRIGVTVSVPTDATDIDFRILATAKNAANDYFYVGKVMIVASDSALTALPYVPRLPINLTSILANTEVLRANGVNSGSGDIDVDDVSWSTPWDLPTDRPAWCSAVVVYPYMYSTAATTANNTIRGKGSYRRAIAFKSYVQASNSITESPSVVDIGQDGLCTANWSGANSVLSINLQAWIGEGL